MGTFKKFMLIMVFIMIVSMAYVADCMYEDSRRAYLVSSENISEVK